RRVRAILQGRHPSYFSISTNPCHQKAQSHRTAVQPCRGKVRGLPPEEPVPSTQSFPVSSVPVPSVRSRSPRTMLQVKSIVFSSFVCVVQNRKAKTNNRPLQYMCYLPAAQ